MSKEWNIDEMEVIIVPEPKSPIMKEAELALKQIEEHIERKDKRIKELETKRFSNFWVGTTVGAATVAAIFTVMVKLKED